MKKQIRAFCLECDWEDEPSELTHAHGQRVCPECGGDDWGTFTLPDENALKLMGRALRAAFSLRQQQGESDS